MNIREPDIRTARAWLFVPGDRPERFEKAQLSGADVVCLDLEDAVAAGAKDRARENVRAWIEAGNQCVVRVNSAQSDWYEEDIAALTSASGSKVAALIIPKVENPNPLADLGVPIVALVETAMGMHRVHEIAASAAVKRLVFGSLDYALDIGASSGDMPMLMARSTLVLASRLAGLPAPVDGVTANFRDSDLTAADARAARDIGFGGKLCIHPSQVAPVIAAMTPSDLDVAWARSVLALAESGSGSANLDGQMVDLPVIERARAILAQVESTT